MKIITTDFSWIRQKFLSCKKYWPKLKEIILKTLKDLEEDIDLQLKAERIFEIISQILLDICTHIISHSEEEPPQTYSECMRKLGRLNILAPQTAEKAAAMIKMRNIVVHQYAIINYRLLFEGLCELHQDFPQIQKEILAWIDSQEKREILKE